MRVCVSTILVLPFVGLAYSGQNVLESYERRSRHHRDLSKVTTEGDMNEEQTKEGLLVEKEERDAVPLTVTRDSSSSRVTKTLRTKATTKRNKTRDFEQVVAVCAYKTYNVITVKEFQNNECVVIGETVGKENEEERVDIISCGRVEEGRSV